MEKKIIICSVISISFFLVALTHSCLRMEPLPPGTTSGIPTEEIVETAFVSNGCEYLLFSLHGDPIGIVHSSECERCRDGSAATADSTRLKVFEPLVIHKVNLHTGFRPY